MSTIVQIQIFVNLHVKHILKCVKLFSNMQLFALAKSPQTVDNTRKSRSFNNYGRFKLSMVSPTHIPNFPLRNGRISS